MALCRVAVICREADRAQHWPLKAVIAVAYGMNRLVMGAVEHDIARVCLQ